jgi:hypothetical protein
MPNYGTLKDEFKVISGSIYLFPSGSLNNAKTALSASIPQILSITCSSNDNNLLTPPNNTSSYSIITLDNSNNPQRLILRYILGSYNNKGQIISKTPTKYLYKTTGVKDRFVDVPISKNDDSLVVAYKTVNSLSKTGGFNLLYSASLVSISTGIGSVAVDNDFIIDQYPGGSGLTSLSSSLGINSKIGSSFSVRAGDGIGDLSIGDNFIIEKYKNVGKFLFYNFSSGSVGTVDFSGSMVQVGGMRVGSSFKIGGSTQLFSYNVVQEGSGSKNQPYYKGDKSISSASIAIILDPSDKQSGIITGSGAAKFYFSGSGQVGMGTTNPQTDFDIAADRFQIRSKRDSKGIFVNEEGNMESFNKTTEGAATGSEFIMSYARGGSNQLTAPLLSRIMFGASNPPVVPWESGDADVQAEMDNIISQEGGLAQFILNADPGLIEEATHAGEKYGILGTGANEGDILGSLRWVADSGSFDSKYFDGRGGGEMLKIQGRVQESTSAGIRGDMIFYTSTAVQNPPTEIMRIGSDGNVHITGSLLVKGTINTTGIDTDTTSTIDGGSY